MHADKRTAEASKENRISRLRAGLSMVKGSLVFMYADNPLLFKALAINQLTNPDSVVEYGCFRSVLGAQHHISEGGRSNGCAKQYYDQALGKNAVG